MIDPLLPLMILSRDIPADVVPREAAIIFTVAIVAVVALGVAAIIVPYAWLGL